MNEMFISAIIGGLVGSGLTVLALSICAMAADDR